MQTYLAQLTEVLFPAPEDDVGTVTMILTGEDGIPTIVDCPTELWLILRNSCPDRKWRGQWVYWKLDELGFMLGEVVLFDQAHPQMHMACAGNN